MDPHYKPLRQHAEKLHFKCNDVLDDRGDPLAQMLLRETREVREDIERNREPRAVEDRIRQIQRELEKAKDRELPALSPDDADHLFDEYERLRGELRSMPNY